METEKTHLKNMTLSEMQEWFLHLGKKVPGFCRSFVGSTAAPHSRRNDGALVEAPQQAGRDGGHRFGAPSEKAGVTKRRDEKISLR